MNIFMFCCVVVVLRRRGSGSGEVEWEEVDMVFRGYHRILIIFV